MRTKRRPRHFLRDEKQREFLESVAQLAPEVFSDLRKDVLPLYRSAIERDGPVSAKQRKYYIDGLDRTPGYRPDDHVEEAIDRWCLHYNLCAEWIRGTIRQTVSVWEVSPQLVDEERFHIPFWFEFTPDLQMESEELERDLRFVFEHPGWNPFREAWEDVQKDRWLYEGDYVPEGVSGAFRLPGFIDRFEDELKRYRERVEKWAEKHGAEYVGMNVLPEHIGWTVVAHTKRPDAKRQDYNAVKRLIKKHLNMTVAHETIRKRIRAVERLIELPRVGAQRGCSSKPLSQ